MNIYEVILFAAVIGNAWSNVLTEEGHIFDLIRKYFNKLEVKYKKDLSKVFCVFCVSGQVGLWWGVFAFGLSSFLWILTALGAIVLGGFINKLWHL